MTDFKVGDRVTLTGSDWRDSYEDELSPGAVVTVEHVDSYGNLQFVGSTLHWDVTMEGWEVELNTDTPSEHLTKRGLDARIIGDSLSFHGEPEETTFVRSVHRVTSKIAELLIAKNQAYGDSALNPVRIFSKADRMEQLFVRLDDKLSRVQRGHEYPGDDTIRDIIGYCTLVLIAREGE